VLDVRWVGETLIACREPKTYDVMMELDEAIFDVIIQRFETLRKKAKGIAYNRRKRRSAHRPVKTDEAESDDLPFPLPIE